MDIRKLETLKDSLKLLCPQKSVQDALADGTGDARKDEAVLVDRLNAAAADFTNERFARYLSRSHLGATAYVQDFDRTPDRNLDLAYVDELATLDFVDHNDWLVLWGKPGTGKTFFARMLATQACWQGRRTRWTALPELMRELDRLKLRKDERALDARLGHYSRFDVLCIDEFVIQDWMDQGLVQELFVKLSESKVSVIICTPCLPNKIDEMFSLKTYGSAVKGRIIERSRSLHFTGEDLRLKGRQNLFED